MTGPLRRRAGKGGDPAVAVAYLRVSTDEQHLGPEAQRAAIERWCDAQGVRLVAVHQDHGVSGGASLEKRPGLLEAIDAIASHKAGLLLVAKRDRLARDVVLAAMCERLVERRGARVVSADGTGNGAGPEAQLMRTIVDAFAQYERALIGARTSAAMQAKAARGELVGSVPYGFELAPCGRRVVPLEGEQRVVARVRALRTEGLSLRAIARRLEQDGLRPRSGRRWHPQTVARIANAAEEACAS